MKLSKLASAVGFTQFLGLASAKAEEDDEKKDKDTAKKAEDEDMQRADESDEDYAKRMDEKEKEDAKKAEKSDDDEDDDKKVKKGEKAEDDDADTAKKAVRVERIRCARIIAHGLANGCARQAGVFAFDTDLTAAQAISALQASAADSPRRPTGLRERMSETAQINVGADGGSSAPNMNDPAVAANAIILAGKRRRGEA